LFIKETSSKEEVFDDAFSWDLKKKGGEDIYDEIFAWDRCLSRLKEMQTEYYYKKQHKFYKEENNK
jgi:predicted ATPase